MKKTNSQEGNSTFRKNIGTQIGSQYGWPAGLVVFYFEAFLYRKSAWHSTKIDDFASQINPVHRSILFDRLCQGISVPKMSIKRGLVDQRNCFWFEPEFLSKIFQVQGPLRRCAEGFEVPVKLTPAIGIFVAVLPGS